MGRISVLVAAALWVGLSGVATAAEPAVSEPRPLEFTGHAFRHMDDYFPGAMVARGDWVQPLVPGAAIVGVDFSAFAAHNHSTGLVVLHEGKLRFEGYFNGADVSSHFTSWSVAKSITATLMGLALADGSIESLDAPVTRYLPELGATAYASVSIEQVLQMSSGVRFDETYANGEADIGVYMRWARSGDANGYLVTRTERVAPPGTRFNYNSSETQLVGAVVRRAIEKPLAEFLSERIWKSIGAEADAWWFVDRPGGMEIASMGVNARLRDYARFGLLMARDGVVNGKQILPQGWVARATTPSHPSVAVGKLYEGSELGYQYQWWVRPNGDFMAQGVFGQFIYVDRKRDLVIASAAAWPDFWVTKLEADFYRFVAEVQQAIDDESAAPPTIRSAGLLMKERNDGASE